jgi:hypothetical protein
VATVFDNDPILQFDHHLKASFGNHADQTEFNSHLSNVTTGNTNMTSRKKKVLKMWIIITLNRLHTVVVVRYPCDQQNVSAILYEGYAAGGDAIIAFLSWCLRRACGSSRLTWTRRHERGTARVTGADYLGLTHYE